MEENNEELLNEEVEETPPEESSEVDDNQLKENQEETPKPEYTKERFDGLMSQWQKDRQKMLDLEKKVESIENASKPKNQDDVWIDYLDDKLAKKKIVREAQETAQAQRELDEVSALYPGLSPKAILDRAIKYKITLKAAAEVLTDINKSQETGKNLNQDEIKRKQTAGKIGGKPSGSPKKGLTSYDPKLSLRENIEKGVQELG